MVVLGGGAVSYERGTPVNQMGRAAAGAAPREAGKKEKENFQNVRGSTRTPLSWFS